MGSEYAGQTSDALSASSLPPARLYPAAQAPTTQTLQKTRRELPEKGEHTWLACAFQSRAESRLGEPPRPARQQRALLIARGAHAIRVILTQPYSVCGLEVVLIISCLGWHFVCYFFFSLALTTVQLDTKMRLRFTKKVKWKLLTNNIKPRTAS